MKTRAEQHLGWLSSRSDASGLSCCGERDVHLCDKVLEIPGKLVTVSQPTLPTLYRHGLWEACRACVPPWLNLRCQGSGLTLKSLLTRHTAPCRRLRLSSTECQAFSLELFFVYLAHADEPERQSTRGWFSSKLEGARHPISELQLPGTELR